jgi:uncharacterized protein (TIGR00369 family)
MKDKASSLAAKAAFDPAANGWTIQETSEFPNMVGPFWMREEGSHFRLAFVVERKHLNRAGNVHGGMLMTFADQVMALTGRRATGDKRHATIELNIQFVGAVHLGDFVEAQAEAVRTTRSVTFMRATMYVGKRVVATTSGIWKILEKG